MKLATLRTLIATLFLPGSLLAQDDVVRELREIRFSGAQSFPEILLRSAIISDASRCRNAALDLLQVCRFGIGEEKAVLDLAALQSDLLRLRTFYFERGYRAAQVVLDTAREGDALIATFKITENQPIVVGSIELKGLEQFDPAQRRQVERAVAQLPLRAGAPLSLIDHEAGRDTLLNRIQNLGYARAEVFAGYLIPRDTQNLARVEYDLVLDNVVYFGAPEIRGNEKVSSTVIRRMLDFRRGDRYSRDAILRTQRNLFGLDVFRNIDVRVDLNSVHDTVTPIIEVGEGSLNRFRVGVGMNTSEFINAEGRWIGRDFLGGARRIELRGRIANVLAKPLGSVPAFEDAGAPYDRLSGSLTADFTQPWFFDPSNNFNLGLFLERRSIPDVFVRSAVGGYVGITRLLGSGTTASLSYRPELTELTTEGDVIFCVSLSACDESAISVLREPHWLAPLSVSLSRDRSNSLFAPTRGSIIRLEAEYAAGVSGSEFSYLRAAGEWTLYREPLRGLVLASRIRPGWAHSLDDAGLDLGLHPQKRFFAGGANSVRGFGQYQLGPKLLTIDAAEDLLDADPESGFVGCTAQQINAGSCDVASLADGNAALFDIRPVGGAVSFEANLELRYPLFGDKLRGAAFVDVGQVWSADQSVRAQDLVFTPGLGLRYFSAIGPVRIDVGYNPQSAQLLNVLTTKVCDRSESPCTPDSILPGKTYTADQLANTRELRSLGAVEWGDNRPFFDRLQLHFSIGQAF